MIDPFQIVWIAHYAPMHPAMPSADTLSHSLLAKEHFFAKGGSRNDSGVTDRLCEIGDVVKVLVNRESQQQLAA